MNEETRQQLIKQACLVRERAYARYSHFEVGAALLIDTGQIVTGCNVENASYGLTNCAERTALFSAVSQGLQRFQAIAIASSGGVSPCGACRQVLAEFAPDLPILLIDVLKPGQVVETNLAQLFPGPFRL
jgi:cytidine deaminase